MNKQPSDEIQVAYPYVSKTRKDTVGWEYSVIYEGLPPVLVPIEETVTEIVDSIDFSDFAKYADVTNPKPSELDSLVRDAYCRTKGPSDWNINDWPYFGKYMTE